MVCARNPGKYTNLGIIFSGVREVDYHPRKENLYAVTLNRGKQVYIYV